MTWWTFRIFFIFSGRGKGKGESEAPGGRGGYLLKIPGGSRVSRAGGGGGGRGAGRAFAGNLERGG